MEFWWHHEEERLKPLFFCFTLYFNKIQRFSFLCRIPNSVVLGQLKVWKF